MLQQQTERMRSLGLLILRVGMGAYMVSHGVGKIQMLVAGEFAGFGNPIGIGNAPSLVLVTLAEFLCALLVMVGLATRIAAAPVVIAMAVAAFVAHANDPWSMGQAAQAFFSGESTTWFSKEPALLFLISFLALMFTGAGSFSLDAFLQARHRRENSRDDAATPA